MSRRSPKISLGMPVYNGAAFLRETLESLLQQTFSDFELIISDNASTDATEKICREFAQRDSRIRYERLDTNLGAVANFNRLVDLASGEYYKWVAADDLCLPDFLASTFKLMEADPETVWVHTSFGKIDQHGKILRQDDEAADQLAHSSQAGQPRPFHDADARRKRFKGVLLGTTWCADIFGLIRKSVLDKTARFPACFGAEKVLLGELALWGKYRHVNETLFYQRVHSKAAGEMATRSQQEAYVTAQRKKNRFAQTRIALLKGHLKSVKNVPMPIQDRLLCWSIIARYVVQFSKWPSLLKSEWKGEPIRRLSQNRKHDQSSESNRLARNPELRKP
jgi:glycosyltransferase involved in cell wall biosynthesis